MRTSADAVSETASRGIHRLLNGVKERIQEVLGPTEKIQPELFRASVDLRLPRAFRELAVCEGKNFQKVFELHFGTGEPTITDKGLVSWCHIGLWQAWDRTKAFTMAVFADCDQLAKAVERLAEFYDAGLGISVMEPIVRKLVVALKSNADTAFKTIPIDFVVEAVSVALAKMAVFILSPPALVLTEEQFVERAAAIVDLKAQVVAVECMRMQLGDRDLKAYKQRGTGNAVVLAKVAKKIKLTEKVVKEGPPSKKPRLTVKPAGGAASTSGSAGGGGASQSSGLCYKYTAHFFKVDGSGPCDNTPCRQHPVWALPVPKDEIKGQLVAMQNKPFRDKILAAIDAF
jgi:hypothetical protein